MPTQKRDRKQILLRLDPAVHEALATWAADELRSVNAQIEMILRRALKDAGRDPKAAPMRGRGRPPKVAAQAQGGPQATAEGILSTTAEDY